MSKVCLDLSLPISPDSNVTRTVRILGTHGVPANYGGFETAAENIALFLASRGWRVVVYCQTEGPGTIVEDEWQGIERVIISVDEPGWRGTSKFDYLSIAHACQFRDVCLTFGYNTGIYNLRQWLLGIPNIINMDGIEWSRKRWGRLKQAILYVNERFAALYGTVLIADHPEIEKYLWTRAPRRKVAMIAYGADPVENAPTQPVIDRGLVPRRYFTLIARSIPENSILELIQGFSARHRHFKLVVLGKYDPKRDPYHKAVMEAASEEVVFVGPIYDRIDVQSLRFHSVGYLHGHTVGGTNPSLVEAMAAKNPVIAHDNAYNRWVVGDGGLYFQDVNSIDEHVNSLIWDADLRMRLTHASFDRFQKCFTWKKVAMEYEDVLLRFIE
jgi:glycosyltransferase involved in cell wall biosynthesis